MRLITIFIAIFYIFQSALSQRRTAEDYYADAYDEITSMLSGKDTLSIKRAVFLAEWAYYEGKLDYHKDFCSEIDRICEFVNLFYRVNNLSKFKTGKQMALNEYFFRPYSGNNHKPYVYDFKNFSMEDDNWETQFVSKVLKSHEGQCRSLPWMYKILAVEIEAEAYLAHAPRHCYIMYKDEDNLTPEEWINLELTTHQFQPTFWIKQDYHVCDSAVIVGTYMTPMTDRETVASQLADLAFGYREKFKRYDKFTLNCANKSLEYYPKNPNAIIIRGKSLDKILDDYILLNNGYIDDYALYLSDLIYETQRMLNQTYMTVETPEMRERRVQQTLEAQKYTNERLISK